MAGPQLTPLNAIDFLNTTFEELSLAEAADKGHKLDDALGHYEQFISRAEAFLASPIAKMLQEAGLGGSADGDEPPLDPNEIRAVLPGVQLRVDRLRKMRSIRDAPPVPGAIPLTGPNAGASIAPECVDEVARRAAAAAAAAAGASHGAGPNGSGAQGPTPAEQRAAEQLKRDMRAAAGAAAAATTPGFSAAAAAAAAGAGAAAAGNGPAAAGSTASSAGPLQCGCCGAPGRFAAKPDGDAAASAAGTTLATQEEGQQQGQQLPALLRCGGCRQAYYCSAACQRSAWPQHKPVCQRR